MTQDGRKKRVSRPKVQARRDAARRSRTHYGLDELAARIGVSEETIRDLITRGELTAIRFRRRVLVDAKSWEDWVRKSTIGAK